MRRLLGVLLLGAIALVGCGDDEDAAEPGPAEISSETTTAPTGTTGPSEPTTYPTDRPTKSPPITPPTLPEGDVVHTLVALESQTAAGGSVQAVATPVGPGEGAGTGEFLAQLTGDTFREVVEQQILSTRADGDLYAAVVAVACDVPPGVVVSEVTGGYAITARKVSAPTPECAAPVTTVAVVAIPD